MQGLNASTFSQIVLMCPVMMVLGMELMCSDNLFAPGILGARVLSM